ncbi:MAG: hypothetical protein O4861_11955 [Trichodesmium sp. St16_bin4-tuft]|nr:hypothetical protein [Trichodesmium erythraeum GBRTRLIN201]MCH2051322.1 hypothetical protein [Trichodesmium sp. ALOHA_ZT_67]MCL2930362.1 hypothetical protein [Trichodesmium sp. MAG_R01]MDE5095893.1 hypothetical protein [Trichodesmium sp. St11_bin5]MDE5099004.1 hypothetical protein [Trichodesmium sp. St16_bin4-tuft]
MAERVSPIHYVHSQLLPIFTVHGDTNLIVPYNYAVRFYKLLNQANALN